MSLWKLALVSGSLLASTAYGQGLESQIRSAFEEYSQARTQLDPARWTNDQHLYWATRFMTLHEGLDASIAISTRDEVRSTLLALLIPIQDFVSARAVVRSGMAEQTGCEGKLKWGNFALGVEKAESQVAGRMPSADVVLSITRSALQGCDSLSQLQYQRSAFAYAVVLHHASACCESDLHQRAARLLELERTVGETEAGRSLVVDRFALLVDAAKALCAAGQPVEALKTCDLAHFDDVHSRDHAITSVVRDASIALDRRITFVETSVASRTLGVTDVNRMAGLVNELVRRQTRESAQTAITLIDRLLAADAMVLQQVNEQHVAHRVEAEGQPPRSLSETRAFESSMCTTKWFLHRAVLRDPAATRQDAADILSRFPDHPLRQISNAACDSVRPKTVQGWSVPVVNGCVRRVCDLASLFHAEHFVGGEPITHGEAYSWTQMMSCDWPNGRSLDSDVQIAALLRDWARKIVPEAFDGRTAE